MMPFVGLQQRGHAGVEFAGHAPMRVGHRGGRFRRAAADGVDRRGLFGRRRLQTADQVGVTRVEFSPDAFMRFGDLVGVALAVRAQCLDRGVRHRLQSVDDIDAQRLLLDMQPVAGFGETFGGGFGALGQAFGGLGGGFREGIDQMAAAVLEVAANRVMRLGDARDGELGMGLQRHRGGGGRLGQTGEQGVGLNFERLRHEVVRVGDAFAGQSAARIQRFQRVLGRALQRLDQRASAIVEAAGGLKVGVRDGGGDGVGLLAHRLDGAAPAVVEPVDQPIAVLGEIARQHGARIRQPRGEGIAMTADRLQRLRAGGGDAGGDIVAAGRDRVARRLRGGLQLHHHAKPFAADGAHRALGRFGEVLADFLVTAADFLDQGFAARAKRIVELFGPLEQLGGARFGSACNGAGDLFAEAAQSRDARRRRALDRLRELLGRRSERDRRHLADLFDAGGELLADRFELPRRAALRGDDRVAHGIAVGEDRLALIGEFGDQRAQTPLMLTRGAFERRQFVAHQRFEFGRARERALHAVAHRGDFAPDRLRQRRELLIGHRFRLGQPNRDMGDRGGRLAQILQSPGERDKADQRHHRRDRRQQKQHGFRAEQQRRRRERLGHPLVAVIAAQGEPDERGQHGQRYRRAARSLDLQRLHDRPCGGAIVIGVPVGRGQAQLGRLGLPARLLRFGDRRLERRGLGRRRRGGGGLGGRRRSFGGGVLLGAEIKRVLDREHGLGYGIRRLIFLRHCVRLRSQAIPPAGAGSL